MTADMVNEGETAPSRKERPAHMQWRYLGLVFLGGTVGTGLRELIGQLISNTDAFPFATFGVNVVGAFVLGALFSALNNSNQSRSVGRRVRLFWATGVLGGFTTYSGLATDSVLLTINGDASLAVLYAFGTVVIGAAASLIGIWLGNRLTTGERRHA